MYMLLTSTGKLRGQVIQVGNSGCLALVQHSSKKIHKQEARIKYPVFKEEFVK